MGAEANIISLPKQTSFGCRSRHHFAQDAYGQQVGEDAYYLLACLDASDVDQWQSLPKIEALRIVLERHYEYKAEAPNTPEAPRVRWQSKKELPRTNAGIKSPYDVDARFRSRPGVNWVGYAVNVSETCDDEQCHLITHVETTDASVHEAQRTQVIHQALADKDLLPLEHFVDSAYVSAEHLVNAQKQQIEMVGPTRKNASWQSKIEGGYDETRFDIDWEAKVVTCPEGKQSKTWKEYAKPGSRARVKAIFNKRDCLPCPSYKLCTKDIRRSLSFLPKAQYDALEASIVVKQAKNATSVEQELKGRSRKVYAALA